VTDNSASGGNLARDVETLWRQPRTFWPIVGLLLYVLVHGLVFLGDPVNTVEHIGFGLVLVILVIAYVIYPAWVAVGPTGLRFGQWWVVRKYAWSQIKAFELGNPERAEIAYVIVQAEGGKPRPQALPDVGILPPKDLVLALEAKRHSLRLGGLAVEE
jgi:hypothetical protein